MLREYELQEQAYEQTGDEQYRVSMQNILDRFFRLFGAKNMSKDADTLKEIGMRDREARIAFQMLIDTHTASLNDPDNFGDITYTHDLYDASITDGSLNFSGKLSPVAKLLANKEHAFSYDSDGNPLYVLMQIGEEGVTNRVVKVSGGKVQVVS